MSTLRLTRRLRRLRRTPAIRALVRETQLTAHLFILPFFDCERSGVHKKVSSMPGVFQLSVVETVEAFLRQDYNQRQVILAYNTPTDLPVEDELHAIAERDRRFVPMRVGWSTSKAQNVNAALARGQIWIADPIAAHSAAVVLAIYVDRMRQRSA